MQTDITKKLDTFFSSYPSQTFSKGTVILQAGEGPTGIFYITEGIVRNYWISQEGTEVTLNMYKPHSFLPMSWAIGEVKNTSFYEAMTPVVGKKAPKEVFLQFLKGNPEVMYDLLRRIYVGMEGLWMHIESLTTGDSSTKLTTSLVILAKRFGIQVENSTVVQLKMNEKDIANYAGITRETASRELQKLKKENLVSFEKGTITLHTLGSLEEKLLR
ncbi:MAG TPA: Crp/Fnr family transcriptional regulator [Candidatus Eisenbacteria bacterium]|nr:Crp/Fnr family transcriptional regulator [Candidatus Eisenbacteria bacterium]